MELEDRRYIAAQSLFFASSVFSFIFPLQATILLGSGLFEPRHVPWAQAIASFLAGLMQPVIGRLADAGHSGAAATLAIAFLGAGVGGLLLSEAWTSVVALAAVLTGIATAGTLTSRFLQGLVRPRAKLRASLYTHLAENAGLGLSAVVAYFLLKTHREALLILDVVTTTALVVAVTSWGLQTAPHATLSVATISRRSAFADLLPTLVAGLTFVASFGFLSALPVHVAVRGLPVERLMAIIFGIATAVVCLVTAIIPKDLADSHRRTLFTVGCVALAGGYGAYPFVASEFAFAICTAIWATGEALALPIAVAAIFEQDLAPGRAAARLSVTKRAALVVTPLVALLANCNTSNPACFTVVVASPAFLALGLGALRRDRARGRAISTPEGGVA